MSGFDPTNPFAAPADVKPVADAFSRLSTNEPNSEDPFRSGPDPFGTASSTTDPFATPGAVSSPFGGADSNRTRAYSTPWTTSSDPFAPPGQQQAATTAFVDPFAPASRTSVSDITTAVSRARSESVTVFGSGFGGNTSNAGTRRASSDIVDLFDPLAPSTSASQNLDSIPEAPAPAPPAPVPAPAQTFTAPAAPKSSTPPPVPARTSPTLPARSSPSTTTSRPSAANIANKYSVEAVLAGAGVGQKQTIVVGSTTKEERLDEARGLEDVQYVGYRGYLGYAKVGFSSTDKREFRVKKSPQSAIRITLKAEGVSVCKCPGSCNASHREVAYVPYKELKRLRHVQTDSKKGFHYLALETKDGETFVIYSQQTKMIKAGINTRYNTFVHGDDEHQSSESQPTDSTRAPASETLGTPSAKDLIDDPFAAALNDIEPAHSGFSTDPFASGPAPASGSTDPFASSDPFAPSTGAGKGVVQDEWWK